MHSGDDMVQDISRSSGEGKTIHSIRMNCVVYYNDVMYSQAQPFDGENEASSLVFFSSVFSSLHDLKL